MAIVCPTVSHRGSDYKRMWSTFQYASYYISLLCLPKLHFSTLNCPMPCAAAGSPVCTCIPERQGCRLSSGAHQWACLGACWQRASGWCWRRFGSTRDRKALFTFCIIAIAKCSRNRSPPEKGTPRLLWHSDERGGRHRLPVQEIALFSAIGTVLVVRHGLRKALRVCPRFGCVAFHVRYFFLACMCAMALAANMRSSDPNVRSTVCMCIGGIIFSMTACLLCRLMLQLDCLSACVKSKLIERAQARQKLSLATEHVWTVLSGIYLSHHFQEMKTWHTTFCDKHWVEAVQFVVYYIGLVLGHIVAFESIDSVNQDQLCIPDCSELLTMIFIVTCLCMWEVMASFVNELVDTF